MNRERNFLGSPSLLALNDWTSMPVCKLLSSILRIFLCLTLCYSLLPAETADDIAETNENLKEVLKFRNSLAKEKLAWREQKALMEAQIRVDQTALENLEAMLQELQPELDALGEQGAQLAASLETSKRLVDFWLLKIEAIKRRLAELASSFPPALKRQVSSKLSDALVLDYGDDLSKLKRVFDLCLEVVSEVNQFHQEIHLLTEVHKMENGQRAEFRVVYLGLSGGYYFSENAGLAGKIVWQEGAWQWLEDRALLEDLILLRAVLSGQMPPQYINLPMPTEAGGAP